MICFPLDNTEYAAEALGAYMATRTRGVLSADGNLEVTANGNMTILVSPGIAWLSKETHWGTVCYQRDSKILTLSQADGQLSRIDAVCCKLDKNANTADIILKKGQPALNPVVPAIERSIDTDEIYLATITVPAGATAISAADITDQRLNEQYCGLMRDGVTGIPTEMIYAQFEELLNRVKQLLFEATEDAAYMVIDTYDSNRNGIVDNAELLGGLPPSSYMTVQGGTFLGTTIASEENYAGSSLRNIVVKNADGTTAVSTGTIEMWRK